MEARSLSSKQSNQLFSFSEKTMSHIHKGKAPLIELMKLACIYCTQIRLMDDAKYRESLEVKLFNFDAKYFPFGSKPSICSIDYHEVPMWNIARCPRFAAGFIPHDYNPIEKVAFVMSLRTSYRYITGEISRDEFIDKLDSVRIIIE